MATFTVTTTSDVVNANDGVLSLREAVLQANATAAADTIVFAPSIEGRTLMLSNGQLLINQDITIDGDQNGDGQRVSLAAISGSHLRIEGSASDVNMTDLSFIGASTSAVTIRGGTVDISSCTFSENRGYGAISAIDASVTVESSIFSDNVALEGGAISAYSCELNVSSSLFVSNEARYGGGALSLTHSDVSIDQTAIFANRSIYNGGGGISGRGNLNLHIFNSEINENSASYYNTSGGGLLVSGNILIENTSIVSNSCGASGGGIAFSVGTLALLNSTIADNISRDVGGGISAFSGEAVLRNATITDNQAGNTFRGLGGGVWRASPEAIFDFSDSIIAGNRVVGQSVEGVDIVGTINFSNGHNIFGSDVLGNVSGDRELVSASAIFASIDPIAGGGQIDASGVVLLRANVSNPALGGADRLLMPSGDQLGARRAAPGESNPDAGAVESGFAPSKIASANNDVLTGTAAGNTISGLAGHDFIKGLAGNDTLNGNDGGDFLTGGLGNDRLNGGNGIDIVNYADRTVAVTVDLRGDAAGDTDTARRGTETDTLTGIEGAIGSSASDTFFGDSLGNWFQGGGGKDTYTGGGGRDLYDFNLSSAAGLGTSRDVITDFALRIDKIDLMGIDADAGVAGNQAFQWMGTAPLTGAGQLGYFISGGNTIIRMSTDADAASEGEIQLTGIKALTSVDFYL